MTELERLLVRCVEPDPGPFGVRVVPGSLGVVADLVEEHSHPLAVGVRAVCSGPTDAVLESRAERHLLVEHADGSYLMIRISPTGPRRTRRVLVDSTTGSGNVRRPADAGRFRMTKEVVHWSGSVPFEVNDKARVASLRPAVRVALWHAVVHLLGYTPLALLARCAVEA